MRLLLDTSIFLEILLEQRDAQKARELLTRVSEHSFFVTDFSVHSIGLKLIERKKHDDFRRFVKEVLLDQVAIMLQLDHAALKGVADRSQRLRLDFDDAYQYTAAEQEGLTIVSYDRDFDRTPRRRKTPGEILVASG
ncbi:MAG: type II toxin-antitoxin system VapC family toxin [Planctomycetes bacterium]|nr:type II toxin-antitoxin system VapC family toxin [Planctomycetota bacterium]